MRYFLCLVILWVQAAIAQDVNPDKRHVLGIDYQLTTGNLSAYMEENYDAGLWIPPNSLVLHYTYFLNGRISLNVGFIGGIYMHDDYEKLLFDGSKHKMEYWGIKPGIGVQVSRTLGRSVVHYNIALAFAEESMRLKLSDPYAGWTSYYEETMLSTTYIYLEIGQRHHLPITKSGNMKFLIDYGIQINPYINLSQFKNFQHVQTTVPGIGTWRLFSPYVSLGIGYGFNTK